MYFVDWVTIYMKFTRVQSRLMLNKNMGDCVLKTAKPESIAA